MQKSHIFFTTIVTAVLAVSVISVSGKAGVVDNKKSADNATVTRSVVGRQNSRTNFVRNWFRPAGSVAVKKVSAASSKETTSPAENIIHPSDNNQAGTENGLKHIIKGTSVN